MRVAFKLPHCARGNIAARCNAGFIAFRLAFVLMLIGVVGAQHMLSTYHYRTMIHFIHRRLVTSHCPIGTVLRDRTINAQYLLPFLSAEVLGDLG